MVSKTVALCCCVAVAACSSAEPPSDREDRLPEDRTRVAPPTDEPDEGTPPCTVTEPTSPEGWSSYSNGHFSFRAPSSLFLDLIGISISVGLERELRDNTDPAVSRFFAETFVQQDPTYGAYYFEIHVGEVAAPGDPEDRVRALAEEEQGLPPMDSEHLNRCGVTATEQTLYACVDAVDSTLACWTRRGYAYTWSRFVYTAGRVYEMTCRASGIVNDKETLCADVLDSLAITE